MELHAGVTNKKKHSLSHQLLSNISNSAHVCAQPLQVLALGAKGHHHHTVILNTCIPRCRSHYSTDGTATT